MITSRWEWYRATGITIGNSVRFRSITLSMFKAISGKQCTIKMLCVVGQFTDGAAHL